MDFIKKLFKKKSKPPNKESDSTNIENNIEKQLKPPGLSRLIRNFKFIHNGNSYKPKIEIDYELLKEEILCGKYSIAQSWELAYSSFEHGLSKRSFHMFLKNHNPPFLFIIQDTHFSVFGVFFDSEIEINRRCFGKGNTFLFKMKVLEKHEKVLRSKSLPSISELVEATVVIDENEKILREGSEKKVKMKNKNSHDAEDVDKFVFVKFPSTRENDYFCNCTSHYLAFGIGEGRYGLYLDESFTNGESSPVPTFNNERLSSTKRFYVRQIEVWSIKQ